MTWLIYPHAVAPTLELLRGDEELFDAVLSDPPYGLGFMGKGWDHGVPSADTWAAMRNVLRPGASVALFGGTRTYHRLACADEDAGYAIRDSLMAWVYGGGWAKPGDVACYIDDRLGMPRKCSEPPVTPDAEHFQGYHANLKPAHEPILLARVPLDGGLASNALTHGIAGLNIDGCRVGNEPRARMVIHPNRGHNNHSSSGNKSSQTSKGGGTTTQGRWPANVILTCDEAICGPGDPRKIQHQPGCHVYELDRQSGVRTSGSIKAGTLYRRDNGHAYGDPSGTSRGFEASVGTASRFFYVAKVSKRERGVSAHPCMKPIELCTYIARLLLPPPRADGQPRRILVPYSGSGSEMLGALIAGWDEVVGIEHDAGCDNPGKRPDYWADVAEHRIREWEGSLTAEHVKDDIADGAVQLGLLDGL